MPRISLSAVFAALVAFGVPAVPVLADNPSESAAVQRESARANQLFDDIFDREVSRDPVRQTYLGIKTDYDKWTDISDAHDTEELEHDKADLALLRAIDTSLLDADTALSYQLLVDRLENAIEDYRWRYYAYPVNQMFGEQSKIPAFLINQHRIGSVADAEAYIARLNGIPNVIAQLVAKLEVREDLGIIAPDFVFPHVIDDSLNVISGKPFDGGDPSPLMADFNKKVAALDITPAERARLSREAEMALLESVQPAYRSLIACVEQLQKKAIHDAGVGHLPDGEAYYANRLQRITTTDLSAQQIHEIGLSEVKRIHTEMTAIKDKVGFDGSLKDFMEFMRTSPQFYYPNTDEGRAQYLERARSVLDTMYEHLPELFVTLPKAPLDVKAVEPFREKSAGKAFYQQPSPDGARPGIYYVNLYDMAAMPTYQLEAIAYHEGLPGHHMQIAVKQEQKALPKFRRFGGYTAYSEGWGLYAEEVPKEIGLYQDPYSDFGRLSMELWRAVRLVVDTGMHSMGWSREQSIQYYVDNTPNARSDAVKMVERHAVMPGQATAYKIGMMKIQELRDKARLAQGESFDIRQFHEKVLRAGAVPLYVLQQLVLN